MAFLFYACCLSVSGRLYLRSFIYFRFCFFFAFLLKQPFELRQPIKEVSVLCTSVFVRVFRVRLCLLSPTYKAFFFIEFHVFCFFSSFTHMGSLKVEILMVGLGVHKVLTRHLRFCCIGFVLWVRFLDNLIFLSPSLSLWGFWNWVLLVEWFFFVFSERYT